MFKKIYSRNHRSIRTQESVSLKQVHGDKILRVTEDTQGEIDGYDGMVTDVNYKSLVVRVADCQGVMLWDENRKVVANLHNGWRGSAKNIVGKGIRIMIDEYGCKVEDIKVEISPSLGPCCAEFSDPHNELPEELHEFIGPDNHVDFWKATIKQCTNEGVLEENIKPTDICTKCNVDKYFSYRSEGEKAERFSVVIGMNN